VPAEALSDAQQALADAPGPVVAHGGPGTGRTTALVHRWLRLAPEVGAHRVLAVCPTRDAADWFLTAVATRLRGGFDALPVTTAVGLAFDIWRRAGGDDLRLIGRREAWSVVRELLASEGRRAKRRWPTLAPYVGRAAFVEEVARGVAALREAALPPEEVLARAERAGVGPRWAELIAFAERYQKALDARGATDAPGLLTRAATALQGPRGEALRARFAHLLVDDAHALSPAAAALLAALGAPADGDGPGPVPALAGDPDGPTDPPGLSPPPLLAAAGGTGWQAVRLDDTFRAPDDRYLVRCRHPSLEDEAVAGELLAAHAAGTPWSAMAVLVRDPARRARPIARALARHGIPVAAPPAPAAGEPAVRGLVALLRWVDGDASAVEELLPTPVAGVDPLAGRRLAAEARAGGVPLADHPDLAHLRALRDDLAALAPHLDPARLAHEAFRRCLAHLVHEPGDPAAGADEAALDAVAAFLRLADEQVAADPGIGLSRLLDAVELPALAPDPWRRQGPPPAERVTVCPLEAAAGREWDVVVIPGCLDGAFPRTPARAGLFDPALLAPRPPAGEAERRMALLADERQRFAAACARARRKLVALSAPAPGTLVSRFVDAWPVRPPSLPPLPAPPPPAGPETVGVTPVWDDPAKLPLSATRLATYEDCPLKFAVTYVLRAEREATVWASFGSLVHEVLAAFCDPRAGHPRTLEQLFHIANDRWRDDLARYRPQLEELRRDLADVLQRWWEEEGVALFGESRRRRVVAVEREFAVRVGEFTVAGRIDRIDETDAGLEVIDIKTAKTPARPDEVADDLQLAVYHLATCRDPELARAGRPVSLRLHYVRSGKVLEQPITPDHEARTTERITELARRILAEEFAPSTAADCDHCDFHRLCPLQAAGREVGVEA
jgi:superfamily I DNA/RNA helicase/CRISPR/Cas system-associated exonuclease Cas4 (RecB family)